MRALRTLTTALCVAFAAQNAFMAPTSFAAVPVVESSPSTGSSGTVSRPTTTTSAPISSPATSSGVRSYGVDQPQVVANDPIRSTPPNSSVGSSSAGTPVTGTTASTMFQQIQQLQDDVAELRGMLEEQTHQIEKLQADQKEQYLDLDRRMTALKGGAAAGGATAPTGPVAGGGAGGGNTTVGGGSSATSAASNSERDAYTKAFNLTKDKRFPEAIAAFNQMLVSYPNGEYAGNAYYWLGEMYRATSAPEKARQSFAQVVNQFPTNAKVSDAMYKLGVVYNELGDRAKALEYLKRVQSQFPGTPAASLAQSYAAELK
ncbi:MAG TPA: tol-pal system protein YbgF [Pseudomonadales bacterium]|nr:tol-pal system protein YbgF [Pseudomonadales bacterium]